MFKNRPQTPLHTTLIIVTIGLCKTCCFQSGLPNWAIFRPLFDCLLWTLFKIITNGCSLCTFWGYFFPQFTNTMYIYIICTFITHYTYISYTFIIHTLSIAHFKQVLHKPMVTMIKVVWSGVWTNPLTFTVGKSSPNIWVISVLF
jgi:hypothetical protein